MKFKLQATEEMWSGLGGNEQTFTSEFSAVTLNEVVQQVEQFLRGCGYYLENLDYDIPEFKCKEDV